MAQAPARPRSRPSAPSPTEATGPGLQTLLEALPEAFLGVDAGWRITWLSRRMRELLGPRVQPGDDVRKKVADVLGLSQHLRLDVPATEQPSSEPYEHRWHEDSFCFEVSTRPVDGGLLVHCRDITREFQARHELQRVGQLFQAVMEGTTDAIYIKDMDGTYQVINSAGARAVGRSTVAEVRGRTDEELFPPDEAKINLKHDRDVLKAGHPLTYEDSHMNPSGDVRVWQSTKGPLRDPEGNVFGLFGISRDITQRKWAEDEVRRHAEFQEHLMGIISHDIRSPLGAIMNWSRVLAAGGPAEETARTSQRIATAAVRIERLTRLLLDFTRARLVGGVVIEPRGTDTQELLAKVAHEFRVAFPKRDIVVDHKGNTQGHWDPDRLAQVVSNLVENALKYGPADAPVLLSTRGLRNKVVVTVHNQGRPIPEATLPHLFEPFRQGPQQTRTLKMSYGLGLYIVREIVHAHGGTIEVTSSEDDGTTFTVTLPRRAPPRKGPPPEPPSPPSHRA
ncbi:MULTISPECIES: sensor histidine kinase [Corallococcus]|uniref:sensor histidine kinase n=1 Tax=Corallococcus TaxID=83461 RepID=UPI000EF02FDC|nr:MULTISPECIES: ATP-binding protein [Corallococcus]NPC73572.1 PAS domain-containing protein [Corallococcus exiguus]NPD26006.1 PAS domain-containing protein [Corallococcus exiguus]NRD49270.1 PAS domain-containing protein [Corallococcus exiguus]RKH94712.1 PAS domain S-box protein [Corallococcus sp. AB038B]